MKNAAKYFLLYFSTTYSLLIISIENFVDLFIFIFIVIFIVFIKYKLTEDCVKTNTEIPLIQIIVMRVGSDTFRDPIFQKGLQN